MCTETEYKAVKYWNDLPIDNRLKLLQENCFWDGFKTYLWVYLPEHLKKVIVLKTDKNN
jgi:hypothetical protein